MIQDIAPHQYDVAYRTARAKEDSVMLIYADNALLCRMEQGKTVYPSAGEIAKAFPLVYEKAKFLFRMDGRDYFELPRQQVPAFLDWEYLPKERLRNVRPIWKAFAGITGYQIHKWYEENRFCGCCGARMEPQSRERALRCSACGKLRYPQICPSVIVGVTYQDRILLTKYASGHSSYQNYALIAGYVEVGESLEDTVRREVMEEVGLKVKNIRYYKSQPWPFTDTLLAGFFCEVDGDAKIVMDPEELSAAEWFERGHLPKERSEAEISLTGEMMNAFRDGCELYEKS